MSLNTGELYWCHAAGFSPVTGLTGSIGGAANTGSPVVFSPTGLFPTGMSSIPGGYTQIQYVKIFLCNSGDTSDDVLTNPSIYLSNISLSNQISMAPDPYFLGIHAAQTGEAANRATLPGGLSSSHFTGYNFEVPMDLSKIYGSTVTLETGQQIGVWIRRSIQPGLSSSNSNSFSIVVRGEI